MYNPYNFLLNKTMVGSIKLKQWDADDDYDYEEDKYICNLEEKLTNDPEEYTSESSLIYKVSLKWCMLNCDNDIPTDFITLKLYIVVCSDGRQLLESWESRDYVGCLKLNKAFAKYSPHNFRYTSCNGDKCRRVLDPFDTNIWCTACHGYFDKIYMLEDMFRYSIDSIPLNSVLHAGVKLEPIDWYDDDEVAHAKHIMDVYQNNKNFKLAIDELKEMGVLNDVNVEYSEKIKEYIDKNIF